MDFPELMPPTLIARDRDGDRGVSRRARRSRDEAALRLRRRGGVQGRRARTRTSARCSICSPSRFREPWVIQKFLPAVSLGDKRIILVDGEAKGAVNRVPAGDDIRSNMVRGGAAQETELTPREREICAADRPGAQAPRPRLRRHRRDRRLSHGNQRHLADRHPGDQAPRRPGSRGRDLGRDRGQTGQRIRNTTEHAAPCRRGAEGEYSRNVCGQRPRGRTRHPLRARRAPPARGSTGRSCINELTELQRAPSRRPRRLSQLGDPRAAGGAHGGPRRGAQRRWRRAGPGEPAPKP